ncbi:hypothetical protein E2C01_083946 [Portunus trituberculatus]|uniref:Uncharacterized protein n=1 Tax=Portunus trituberculatus TaxID=210409 RepID=A0A5B7J7W6_PORTR|nr:hypothetical protein [Portunus trituberculatus]
MKSLAGVKWVADRCTLLHFYCIYIQSRLDYACEIYGAASQSLLHKLNVIQNSALRIALGACKSSPVCALQAEASLPSLSHRRSTFLVRTYTKLTSSPRCHAFHSLLLRHGREPLYGPLPYKAHTPFVDRALSFFATLRVTPPLSSSSKKLLWALGTLSLPQSHCPYIHPHNGSKPAAQCRAELYSSHSSTRYHTHFYIYTRCRCGSGCGTPMAPASLPLHPSVQPYTSPPGPLPLSGGYRPLPPSLRHNRLP